MPFAEANVDFHLFQEYLQLTDYLSVFCVIVYFEGAYSCFFFKVRSMEIDQKLVLSFSYISGKPYEAKTYAFSARPDIETQRTFFFAYVI